jgi:hypothetical protein
MLREYVIRRYRHKNAESKYMSKESVIAEYEALTSEIASLKYGTGNYPYFTKK